MESTGDQRVDVDIAMLGLWETVAAIGVSSVLGLSSKIMAPELERPASVHQIHHALALDEQRRAFEPILFGPGERVEEVWFPGVHADVTGGYPETGLSDGVLVYMLERCQRAGLKLVDNWRSGLSDDPKTEIEHESRVGSFKLMAGARRELLPLGGEGEEHLPLIHRSVIDRMASVADYNPPHLPADKNAYEIVE